VLHASYGSRPVPPPAPAGPFLGREQEARLLGDLVASGPDRLIAVVGMGGVGKTRLVLAVAHALYERTRTPVLWVGPEAGAPQHPDLGSGARSSPPFQVLGSWLREILARADGAVDDLADFIADRPFLLVLDGYEPEQTPTGSVVRLLSQCPKLRVVSTARAFGAAPIVGQRLLPLYPLPVGRGSGSDADDTRDAGDTYDDGAESCNTPDPAVEIVRWHMRHLRPQWQATRTEDTAIRELCRRLDCIPLALESAAAWSLVASPARLAETAARDPFAVAAPPSDRGSTGRLRDALTDAIADLDAPERAFLSALSDRERPWSLEDAAACTNQSLGEVAYAVHALLVHNLIRPVDAETDQPGTFTVLNTVRHLTRTAKAAQPAQPSAGLSAPVPRMSIARHGGGHRIREWGPDLVAGHDLP
jgi:hypothetical protein